MRNLQRLLCVVMLCCLTMTANAQWPPFLPSLEDQYRQQRDEARQERDEARRIQSQTADSLTRIRSLLAATRIAGKKLDQMRLARIDSLVKAGNGSIGEQSEAKHEAESRAKKLTNQLLQVRSALMEEELTSRFLGWGRKRALKRIREMIPAE